MREQDILHTGSLLTLRHTGCREPFTVAARQLRSAQQLWQGLVPTAQKGVKGHSALGNNCVACCVDSLLAVWRRQSQRLLQIPLLRVSPAQHRRHPPWGPPCQACCPLWQGQSAPRMLSTGKTLMPRSTSMECSPQVRQLQRHCPGNSAAAHVCYRTDQSSGVPCRLRVCLCAVEASLVGLDPLIKNLKLKVSAVPRSTDSAYPAHPEVALIFISEVETCKHNKDLFVRCCRRYGGWITRYLGRYATRAPLATGPGTAQPISVDQLSAPVFGRQTGSSVPWNPGRPGCCGQMCVHQALEPAGVTTVGCAAGVLR